MQQPYRNIGFFYIGLFVLTVAGFTPRIADTPFFGYFASAPQFENVSWIIHFHAIACVAWFVLLITQSFLIRSKRFQLHRMLGKASIGLFALLATSTILVIRQQYTRDLLSSKEAAQAAVLPVILALVFATIFYTLALLKRRDLFQHVAFMLAAALTISTNGLTRLGIYLAGDLSGILWAALSVYGSLIGFWLFEKFKLQRPALKSPYLPITLLFLFNHVLAALGSNSAAWHWIADRTLI